MTVRQEQYRITPAMELERPAKSGALETASVLDDLTGDVLHIDTYGVDARTADSNKTILVFQPWSDYVGRPFSQQRMDLIAESMNARVIGVDNLGVGLHTSDIPSHMQKKIASGDLSQISEMQWKAVEQNSLYDNDSELTLAYFSLGTSMAASMAAHAPEGVTIEDMILWECATIDPQRFGTFVLRYFTEGSKNWKKYFNENPDWVAPSDGASLPLRVIRQFPGHALYPLGVAKHPIGIDLQKAHANGTLTNDSRVLIMNGTESNVSTTVANDRLAEELERYPVDVRRIIHLGEYHAINDSLPRVAEVYSKQVAG